MFFLSCTHNVILCISAHVLASQQQYLELRQMLSKLVSWTSQYVNGRWVFFLHSWWYWQCVSAASNFAVHFTDFWYLLVLVIFLCSFFFTKFEYWLSFGACSCWSVGWTVTPPWHVQNAVARVILGLLPSHHLTVALIELHWLSTYYHRCPDERPSPEQVPPSLQTGAL